MFTMPKTAGCLLVACEWYIPCVRKARLILQLVLAGFIIANRISLTQL